MGIKNLTAHARVIGIALGLLSTVSGCAVTTDPEKSARKRCIALRDHLIDVRLDTAAESVDVIAHRKAFENALGEQFVDDCRALPANQVECSLRARDGDALSSCVPSHQ